MNLSERMTAHEVSAALDKLPATARRCSFPECRRMPEGEGFARCETHRFRWEPEWRRLAREGRLPAKDWTGRTA